MKQEIKEYLDENLKSIESKNSISALYVVQKIQGFLQALSMLDEINLVEYEEIIKKFMEEYERRKDV